MERLDDIKKWKIEMLAKNGGFSDRYIASRVFDIRIDKVSDAQLGQVRTHRLGQRYLLTDWRNGKTAVASQHARSVTKAPTTHKFAKKRRRSA